MESAGQVAKKIGEVIEASSTEFVAESYELHDAPPLGALLRTGDGANEIYAVTCHTRTGSIDPGRRPIARGRDDEDEEEIYRRHPELPQLLRTEFRALVVGFKDGDSIRHYLPPRPPRLHGFVYLCGGEELLAFTERLDFLPTVLSASPPVPADELVAAFLRLAGAARPTDGHAFLVAAGKELARSLSADPRRLSAVLMRMRQ
ncbi:MAG: hypothetical protein ACYC1C_01010 [Chloroflexota bacterium]